MQEWRQLYSELSGWGEESSQVQGNHPGPAVGKGETLLSREGFRAPGVWGLFKPVVSKVGCAHTKAAQDNPLE